MIWEIVVVAIYAAIAVWLLALPLKWSPFRSVRESARRSASPRKDNDD